MHKEFLCPYLDRMKLEIMGQERTLNQLRQLIWIHPDSYNSDRIKVKELYNTIA